MFKKETFSSTLKRDFEISLLDLNSSGAKIRIGPKFRSQMVQDFNTHGTLSLSSPVINSFYSPDEAFGGASRNLYRYLLSKNRQKEISRYFCLTESGNSFPSSAIGGTFEIPFQKIFFWMKVMTLDPRPFGLSQQREDFELETLWPRIEYGNSVPVSGPPRNATSSSFLYYNYIPFAAVDSKKGKFSVEYFDTGKIKYSSERWEIKEGNVTRQNAFNYSKISSFYD